MNRPLRPARPLDPLYQVDLTTERKNMQLLIQLRWLAVVGQVITIALVHYGLDIPLPLREMTAVLMALIVTNLGYLYWFKWRRRNVTSLGLFCALLADVAALAVQLYLSGGASNPFIYLFLLQAILSAVLLSPGYTWGIAAITTLCVIDLAGSSRPLAVQPHNNLYVIGLLTCFALTTVLLVIFLTRMPEIARQPELLQDLDEMQQQLLRCKSIVSNVLLSAGEARADAPKPTTLFRFMDRLIAQWQTTHHPGRFRYHNGIAQDIAIISDTALQQMICNVLDNALEASADEVELRLHREGEQLVIRVLDRGTGFAPEILRNFGKYQQSNKTDRAGRGVGLFLVTNVARSLDGTASARNRDDGGAEVSIQFPLSAITLGETDHGHTPAAAG